MPDLRVVELFAGIGAQRMALRNLGIPHTAVISEIDPHAVRSYEAIHGPTPNLGDIRRVERLPDCDLLTYSFPCQDISRAGGRAGFADASTRSGLLWEVGRLIRSACADGRAPECLVMKNVSAITESANIRNFERWVTGLSSLGYTSVYKILNASDYGVPQHRRRCFMVSRLGRRGFVFPPGDGTDVRLRDLLEEADESYYLPDEKTAGYEELRGRSDNGLIECGDLHRYGYDIANRVYDPDGVCPTIRAHSGGNSMPIIRDTPARHGAGVVVESDGRPRIRFLTPLECWRLMGFPDWAYEAARDAGATRAQLYRQAGNSIAVPCLEAVFRAMYIDDAWRKSPSILDYCASDVAHGRPEAVRWAR